MTTGAAMLLGESSLPAAELSVVLLQLVHLSLEDGVHFPLRLEAIRTYNSILESISRQERRLIQMDQNQTRILSQVAAAVLTVGDYEFQVSLSEALCRLTPHRGREQRANQWFSDSNISSAFCDIRDSDFEVDCRRFLNFVNGSHGDERRVYSLPCLQAFLSSTQLFRPKDDKLDEFWIDFNVDSGCVSFFIDDPQAFLWGSIQLLREDIHCYDLQVKDHETVLRVRLINPIMHGNIRGYMVALTFRAEHQRELEEAAWRVFKKAASSTGGGEVVQNSPSAERRVGRSYSRKKPQSKSQLKILPLSSPSSEDECSSLKVAATSRAEFLFDGIQHSTPKTGGGFQPTFDPTDVSEAHLSSEEPPPLDDHQAEKHPQIPDESGGHEEGSSPSKKESLRKREAADSGYLSDQTQGVTPSKKKVEPAAEQAESCSPVKGSEGAADCEGVWPPVADQELDPESHLTSDITAALMSFRAQLEQHFTGSWSRVEGDVLSSLKEFQQHVSSLLTAVHQQRLLLLQQFENNVVGQLKQLEENYRNLNSMNSQILTFFQSEMKRLSSFCEEHLKKLKTLESDQLRTGESSNH
ncbi:PREDICTED: synaptonemal complex protein 2-like [Cyprinodon variegatus]|uniref:synaptonemal complex protein 2-like n=1 Tax=Cyprinodon variegatus TaxID=28743 RepID=UPI000742C2D9|nr:PREDICTED: synaptonemal complex protein 2-like [Cyprinodon variegatus]